MTAVQTLTYRCPHCQKPVEADPREDGQLMVCPHPDCGRPFRVEVPTAEPIPPAEAVAISTPPESNGHVAAGSTSAVAVTPVSPETPAAVVPGAPEAHVLPTAPTAAVARGETELGTIRPVMFRRYPFRFIAYMGLIVGGLVVALITLIHGLLFVTLLAVAAAAFGGYRLCRWWLRNRNTSLTVTKDRCILRTGVVNAVTTEVPLAEVKDIQINQTLVNRIMKVGDIVVSTSGEGGVTVMVMGMPNPQEIARLMRNQAA